MAVVRQLSANSLRKAVTELSARDADLAAVVARFGRPPMWGRRPGFATLAKIILEQQVSLTSAAAAYRRLQGAAGKVTANRVAALNNREVKISNIGQWMTYFVFGVND